MTISEPDWNRIREEFARSLEIDDLVSSETWEELRIFTERRVVLLARFKATRLTREDTADITQNVMSKIQSLGSRRLLISSRSIRGICSR